LALSKKGTDYGRPIEAIVGGIFVSSRPPVAFPIHVVAVYMNPNLATVRQKLRNSSHVVAGSVATKAVEIIKQEVTYKESLSPLGSELTVWADYLFVNPVADITVLDSPDSQELSDQADFYEELVESANTLAIPSTMKEGFCENFTAGFQSIG
jgi:hypothetical protein